MKLSLLIYGSPTGSQAPHTAYRYAAAALEKGHTIHRVFFYGDAVHTASSLTVTQQDETSIESLWQQLLRKHDIDPVVCIAAAVRRGLLDETEARRHEKSAFNLSSPFTLSGLGQLLEAINHSDRLITFGY